MQNFVLHLPTKIIFGRDTIAGIGQESAAFGKKVLLVYGSGSIKDNGVYDLVVSSLGKAGLEIIEHPGVRSNPILHHVREGIKLAKANEVDCVVAVGGGSVIDSAKAICAGALVDHDVWLFFKGKKGIKTKLPLTCVLTIAAAGSEMNGGMVITNEEKGYKFGTGNQLLKPEVSILDPTATFTVPRNYTAYGAVDVIAHILEFYFTTKDPCTQVQDRLMEGLVLSTMESCERTLSDLEDYNARAEMMWCSTLALNGLTGAGLGMVGFPMHMIEHSLSALYDVPHGAGLSVVMPAWMSWQATISPDRFAQFARRVFSVDGDDNGEVASRGVDLLKKWFIRIGSPVSLSEFDIKSSEIRPIAENAMALAKVWRLKEYDLETISHILEECL
jgi:alcohol dehydrogenase YqhD (iron-dependent ADH family)